MDKLIFIVLDGLNAKTAFNHFGFLNTLLEHGIAARYTVKSEMPAQSRPLYEVLLTGVPTVENGIVSNRTVKLSKEESIFSLAKQNGLKTGAAAYFWVSELYNHAPFNKKDDVLQLDSKENIENGFFYYEDHFPDSHLISMTKYILDNKKSDFFMLHTMNIDDVGHKHGSESEEYVWKTVAADSMLGDFMMDWINEGYNIIVTADHGMNKYRIHNGDMDDDRKVPLYIISDKVKSGDFKDTIVPQLEMAPLMCYLLGIEASSKMREIATIDLEG